MAPTEDTQVSALIGQDVSDATHPEEATGDGTGLPKRGLHLLFPGDGVAPGPEELVDHARRARAAGLLLRDPAPSDLVTECSRRNIPLLHPGADADHRRSPGYVL
ncbi:hypothetical protein [Corynebacterium terpenotabidum]|uniref:hypothetical protein n=1 Tax=Corynebacterium terpenotabidum TaxID=89154 RepID=UPI0012EE4343|nr:hypothetical protein [Corynebacterium terpenotabidum]